VHLTERVIRKVKLVRVRVGGLITGTRNSVVSARWWGKLKLSSKSLDKKDFSGSVHGAHIKSKGEIEYDLSGGLGVGV
jgi:hypothetical protein